MNKLVSVAYTKAELKEQRNGGVSIPAGEQESYPWGLRLAMEDALLKKLGISPKDFEVGGTVSGRFEAKVASLGQRETQGKPRSELSLQIVKLGLDPDGGEELDKGIKAGLKDGAK